MYQGFTIFCLENFGPEERQPLAAYLGISFSTEELMCASQSEQVGLLISREEEGALRAL